MANAPFVFTPPPQVALPVTGQEAAFPVHRIYCIGRNYADHAIEMGHDPSTEPPFFFQKNPDNIVLDGLFPYPGESLDVHHEVELVVALKSGGSHLSADQAMATVFGYGVGLDMTRRDLQTQAKNQGQPWEIAKAFDYSAPMSPLVLADKAGPMTEGRIWLEVNGHVRQDGNINQMIWKIPQAISYLSKFFDLKPGDLIMTGTPAGVGPIMRGDRLSAHIQPLPTPLDVTVV